MNQRLFALLMMMIVAVGCAKQSNVLHDFRDEPRIHCSQIGNIENISNYVIYLNKGDKIPLTMRLDSEVIEIDNEEISVVLKQKVYFRLRMPEGVDAENIKKLSEEDRQKFFKSFMIYLSLDAKKLGTIYGYQSCKKNVWNTGRFCFIWHGDNGTRRFNGFPECQNKKMVSVHRAPHLLHYRVLEVLQYVGVPEVVSCGALQTLTMRGVDAF